MMNKRQKKKRKLMENKQLIKRYPFLGISIDWFGHYKKPDYKYTWYDEIPKGWRKAFGKQLINEIRNELIRCHYLYQYRLFQVKEKYGTLRIYDCGSPKNCKVQDIINKYEDISATTCMYCGKPNQQIVNYRGWLTCICKDCFGEQEKKKADYGFPLKKISFDELQRADV